MNLRGFDSPAWRGFANTCEPEEREKGREALRTLKQVIAEITRDAPSARVMGGERYYARIEIPGSGGAHATLYLGEPDESGTAATYHDADDKGRRVTFQRGSAREEEVIKVLANFLVLHEVIRDRREKMKKKEGA